MCGNNRTKIYFTRESKQDQRTESLFLKRFATEFKNYFLILKTAGVMDFTITIENHIRGGFPDPAFPKML